MAQTIEYIEFQNAAQLIAAIEKFACPDCRLDEVHVKDSAGDNLTAVALEKETLSDGSIVFNLVLLRAEPEYDPILKYLWQREHRL